MQTATLMATIECIFYVRHYLPGIYLIFTPLSIENNDRAMFYLFQESTFTFDLYTSFNREQRSIYFVPFSIKNNFFLLNVLVSSYIDITLRE